MLKKSLIEAYNTNHRHDFICTSETNLDSTVAADDKDLVIEDYIILFVQTILAILSPVVY